jgi:hypothetical protein
VLRRGNQFKVDVEGKDKTPVWLNCVHQGVDLVQ